MLSIRGQSTADLLETLKDVVEEVLGMSTVIVGLASNLPGDRARHFKRRLHSMGVDCGSDPEDERVRSVPQKDTSIMQVQSFTICMCRFPC